MSPSTTFYILPMELKSTVSQMAKTIYKQSDGMKSADGVSFKQMLDFLGKNSLFEESIIERMKQIEPAWSESVEWVEEQDEGQQPQEEQPGSMEQAPSNYEAKYYKEFIHYMKKSQKQCFLAKQFYF